MGHSVMVAQTNTRKGPGIWRSIRCYVYLMPTFIFLAIFCYYPPILALLRSFYHWNGANWLQWAGLANYAAMFHDDVLTSSIWNQVQFSLFTVCIGIVGPFTAAELMFALRSKRAQYWYRVLLVAPMVVPGVVMLLLWKFIYDPIAGLLNSIVGVVGVDPQTWLQDPDQALYCLMFMGFPFVSGVAVLIFLSGLNNIGEDVLDAAKIDGAGYLRRLWSIDIPMAMGQIRLILILGIIGSLNGFGLPLILTDGGPGYATMLPGLHMYHHAFAFDRLGYACALGVVLFLVTLLLTLLSMKAKDSET